MSRAVCFVIMGFGKKTDFQSGRTLDLDKTYKNIIKPAVVESGFECVRADEIQDSGIIDKSMYALLIQAEIVIADISTYNPNAIYELGIRHAVRPYSTIILKEKEGKIPFDLDHNRMFIYSHLGEDIGTDEANRCRSGLVSLIKQVSSLKAIDSPLYEYVKGVNPPKLSEDEYRKIIADLADKEKHIFAIVERAKESMRTNDFIDASKHWKRASEIASNDPYFIQQYALSTYKSKHPSEPTALIDALRIIEQLGPDGSNNDPETLGITGAIYKRLWQVSKDVENLNRAIKYYGRGYKIRNDYYTGENYALCLNLKASLEADEDERIYLKVEAKKTRQNIIHTLEDIIDANDLEARPDKKWIYATLSHCYFALNNIEKANYYEEKFRNSNLLNWEEETFAASKALLKGVL